jgi:hypothetical protein
MDAATLDPTLERRQNRTESALEALTRLVEAARRRSGSAAVTISDPSGLLLAGAGPHRLCEELAAWAPLMVRQPDNDTVPTSLDAYEGRTRLRRLSIDGFEIVVTYHGPEARGPSELDAVSAGCRRILRQGTTA